MELENVKLDIWGKSFDLEVEFMFGYIHDHVIPSQIEALSLFLYHSRELLEAAKEPVRQFCLEANQEWFYNYGDSETGNTQYMTQEDREGKLTDLFRVLTPKEVYVDESRDREEQDRNVVLFFDYCFNEEDELAVVFRNERFDRVCWDWEYL